MRVDRQLSHRHRQCPRETTFLLDSAHRYLSIYFISSIYLRTYHLENSKSGMDARVVSSPFFIVNMLPDPFYIILQETSKYSNKFDVKRY